MTNEGFRMQGHADREILNNTDQVGNSCLTYMGSLDGLTTCCTIYNKMVQMLESKNVGQSWNDWVCQKDTYCNALLHSLVVIDRARKIALIVCTYNEITKNVSGQFLYSWLGNEIHQLVNDTFGYELPVDIIEVCDRSKARSGKTKDTLVNITGARYFKRAIYADTDFPTYLISKGCW